MSQIYRNFLERVTRESSPLSPLRVDTFRALWFASIFSNFGGLIQGVGAGWMMTTISDSAHMVALVQGSTTLPIMVLSLASGALADSYDRRRIMLVAQFFMLIVSACLAVTAWMEVITPWLLLSFTFLIGCGGALNNPSWQASVGDIVPRQEVPHAVLLNGVAYNVTRSVGPAIGGAIVSAAGAAAAFGINSLTYFGLIGVLWRWQPNYPASTMPRETLLSAMTTGVRYVTMSPNIWKVMLRGFMFGGTTIVVLALLPLVARHLVQGDALVYGIFLGAFGVGAVGGAAISSEVRKRLTNEAQVRMAFLAFALCTSIMAISPGMWWTVLALIIGGAAWVLALSLFNTTVQMSTPRWVVGRALSFYQMAIFGGMAMGSWLWGNVAEHFSLQIALSCAAVGMLAGAAYGLRMPLPSQAALNLDPLNRWQQPQISLDIGPNSGPVEIAIEYQINDVDVPRFLKVMTERRRIRSRDGAHDWTLLRDLQNPRMWIERFEMTTWVDYVRFHSRTTKADAEVTDGIQALNQGEWPPRVRRMLIRNPRSQQSRRTDLAAHAPVDIA
jgi:MFS family permease